MWVYGRDRSTQNVHTHRNPNRAIYRNHSSVSMRRSHSMSPHLVASCLRNVFLRLRCEANVAYTLHCIVCDCRSDWLHHWQIAYVATQTHRHYLHIHCQGFHWPPPSPQDFLALNIYSSYVLFNRRVYWNAELFSMHTRMTQLLILIVLPLLSIAFTHAFIWMCFVDCNCFSYILWMTLISRICSANAQRTTPKLIHS